MGARKKKIITSGDRLVDWIFRRFVEFLNYEVMAIRKKKGLRDPDDHHCKALRGFLTVDDEIYLSASKVQHRNKDEMLETLIHEVSHLLFEDVKERHIAQLENILGLKFTDEQKRILKKFIPKHTVKRGPEKTVPQSIDSASEKE